MQELSKLDLKSKKYIIFDMDGTLIDSIGVWNMADQKLIFSYSGKTIDLDTIQKDRDQFFHSNLESDIYLAYCEYLINKYGFSTRDANEVSDKRRDMANEVLANDTDFKKDVVELIRRLKKLGFVLVLATMTTQVQLEVYYHINKKMLSQMNILEAFDFITTKDDVKRKKPDPEIYHLILDHYHAKPEECLIFEDSFTGILASKKAGIEVVNIYDKYADVDRERINELTDYSIDSYREFIDLLNKVYGMPQEKELIKKEKVD